MLVENVAEQFEHIKRGIFDIYQIDSAVLRHLNWQKLYHQILGEQTLDVGKWKASVDHKEGCKTDESVILFWKCVRELSEEDKRKLLYFWCAMVCPPKGIASLNLGLDLKSTPGLYDKNFAAATCFKMIHVPNIAASSKALMMEALNMAIANYKTMSSA